MCMTSGPYPAGPRRTTATRLAVTLLALAIASPAPSQEAAAPEAAAAGGGAAPEPAPVPYTAEVAPLEEDGLAALATAVSQTIRLRERAPTDGFGLIGRVRADLPRLMEALRAEGYWGGSVTATIAGLPPNDPALPALLARASEPVPVVFTLAPGPRYTFGRITVAAQPESAESMVREAARESGLVEGDPARAEAVGAAETAMRDALRRAGHPLAAVSGREIWVDHDRRAMDIAWRVTPGPRATFGVPDVVGQERTSTAMLNRVAARRLDGQDYSPAALERARRALMSLGVFESVRAEPAETLAPGNRLPVTFRVVERPLRAIGGSVSYETNFGLGASVFWEHRNLFGGAERLRLEAEASRFGENTPEDFIYRAFATLTLPEIWRWDAKLIARVGAVRERLDAYDRDAVIASAIAERNLSERLAVQAGPNFETGRIGRDDVLQDFTLVGFLGGVRWDGTTSLLNPTSGQRASFTATPYYSVLDGESYVRLLATGSTYFDLLGEGRGVLALRGSLGSIVGTAFDNITLDKRFYAGGGGSVRGYTFQSIGPRGFGEPADRRGEPAGGQRGMAPAHLRPLGRGGVRRCRQRQRGYGPRLGHAARGCRRGAALPHGDRADPRGYRGPAEPAAGRPCLRAVCRHRAGLLMVRLLARTLRAVLLLLLALPVLVLLLLGGGLLWVNGEGGRATIERLAGEFVPGLTIEGLAGPLPSRLSVARVVMADEQGAWVEVEDAHLALDLLALARMELRITALTARRVALHRLPPGGEAPPPDPDAPLIPALPQLPVSVRLDRLAVERIELGEPVMGVAAALSAEGEATLEAGHLAARLEARRLDAPAQARLVLDLAPGADRLTARLDLSEPPGGLLATTPWIARAREHGADLARWPGQRRAARDRRRSRRGPRRDRPGRGACRPRRCRRCAARPAHHRSPPAARGFACRRHAARGLARCGDGCGAAGEPAAARTARPGRAGTRAGQRRPRRRHARPHA